MIEHLRSNKKGILICFIGIDGSGKSTLSRYLYEELKRRDFNVSCTWWLEEENSLLRKSLRKVGKVKHLSSKSDTNNSNTGNGSITARIFKILYPRIVLLDNFRVGIVKVWLPNIVSRDRIIIFDRFIYDVVFALSKEFDYPEIKRARLFTIYSKLLPNPDLIFVIDVSPEVSYSRRKEEMKSIEDAKSIWVNYQELYSLLNDFTSGKIIRVDNTRRIEIVRDEILKITLDFIRDKNGK